MFAFRVHKDKMHNSNSIYKQHHHPTLASGMHFTGMHKWSSIKWNEAQTMLRIVGLLTLQCFALPPPPSNKHIIFSCSQP